MLMDQYFEAMKGVLAKVETTQRDAIEKTAEEIARRVGGGSSLASTRYRPYAHVRRGRPDRRHDGGASHQK